MKKKSKYAAKRDSGRMMYGPGCCGNSIPMEKIREARAKARREGRYWPMSPMGSIHQYEEEET